MDAKDAIGRTALMMAATLGNAEAVELLLEAGAGVHLKDESGATAVEWAKESGHRHIVDLLMSDGESARAKKTEPECGYKAVLQKEGV